MDHPVLTQDLIGDSIVSTHYQVGIIGCGNIAERHARAYLSVPGLDLVASAEPDPEVASSFKETFGIAEMYEDAEKMLRNESLDIVSICTWHLLHAPQTALAARHDVKAVLCEKPMAIGLKEADHMISACQESGTKLAIAHQRRFYPGWAEARRLILDGAIGAPVLATGHVIDGMLNTGSHTVDGIRYVLGDPKGEWVMGALERRSNRWERDVPIEDCCVGLMAFEGGVQSLFQSDLTTRNEPDQMTVQGSDGLIEVGPDQLRLITSGHDPEPFPVSWDPEIESAANEAGLEGFFRVAYAAQATGLKSWLDGESTCRSQGIQSRHAIELMMALYQSARNHELVRLPLEEAGYPLSLMLAEGKTSPEFEQKYDIRSHERRSWDHWEEYNRLRTSGLTHPEIVTKIFDHG